MQTLAEQLEAKHNPNGDPRCAQCRFIIRPYEKINAGGLCNECARPSRLIKTGRLFSEIVK